METEYTEQNMHNIDYILITNFDALIVIYS